MATEAEKIFEKCGAILKGHFLLTSGLHSPIYWEKFQVLQFPHYTQKLCQMISNHFKNQGVEVVAGPTTGGIILAFEVARELGARSIFAERTSEKERDFTRGFTLKPGERVLVVDDVLTTGKSINEVMAALKKKGATIIGIGVLVDRSEEEMGFGVPLFSCHRSVTKTYSPSDCPLCAEKMPLLKPGSSPQSEVK